MAPAHTHRLVVQFTDSNEATVSYQRQGNITDGHYHEVTVENVIPGLPDAGLYEVRCSELHQYHSSDSRDPHRQTQTVMFARNGYSSDLKLRVNPVNDGILTFRLYKDGVPATLTGTSTKLAFVCVISE